MFTDADIRRNGPKGTGVFNYEHIDGTRDAVTREVKVPHKVDFIKQNTDKFTLAHVNGTLRWDK